MNRYPDHVHRTPVFLRNGFKHPLSWHLCLDNHGSEQGGAMKVPLEIEKQIEQEKIAAYVVNHLPIIKAYADRIGLVPVINQLVPSEM